MSQPPKEITIVAQPPKQTKKAYLSNLPFVTHLSITNYTTYTDHIFNKDYNHWVLPTQFGISHPINDIHQGINPFRNLFAELFVTGKVSWDGQTYSFQDPNGFWHTCKRYNIKPTFPPIPIFTAPTADPYCFRAIAEYYKLFGTYNEVANTQPKQPTIHPVTLKPILTSFHSALIVKPVAQAKRTHYLECSDTSTSEDPEDYPPTKKLNWDKARK